MRTTLVLLAALLALPALAATPQDGAVRAPRMDRLAQCNWDRPGHNPFMGEVVPAIDRYLDIPTPVRMRLKERMAQRRYDDLVDIRRDSIRGKHEYGAEIRDMHFGLDRVCGQVTRGAWNESMRERGLVYCDSGHCILVPTVCRNVSRIERREPQRAAAATGEQDLSAQTLDFDAPSAGAPAAPDSFAAAAAPALPTGGADDASIEPANDSSAAPGAYSWLAGGGGGTWGSTWGSGAGSAGGASGSGAPGQESSAGFLGGPITSGGGAEGGASLPPVTAPVPEPSTWAMMVLGLLAVVVASRRRRPA
jgi:PEP-CTERM motif